MSQESKQIITNARKAYKEGKITKEQLHDVYRIVSTAEAERELE